MRHLSLFTGSGIGDLAAQAAGIQTVAQCESDPVCQYALRRLWPDAHLFEDVRHVTVEALGRLGLLPVDIISGGFPCTDISTAGKGAGLHGKRSGLWFEMLRVIAEVRPRWVLAENVPALRSRGADTVLAGLEAEGYTCWACVVGAWAVGAPHKRDRVWIVAHLCGDDDAWRRLTGYELDSGTEASQGRREEVANGPDNLHSGSREAVANTPQRGLGTDGSPLGNAGHTDQCGKELADTEPDGLQRAVNPESRQGATEIGRRPADSYRWPARPGEPQYDWEAPRITQRGVGCPTDGLAQRILQRFGGSGNGVSPDRAESQTNKSLLRILGNAWVYPLAEMIFRWIAEGAMDTKGAMAHDRRTT